MANYHIKLFQPKFNYNFGDGGQFGYSNNGILESYSEGDSAYPTYCIRTTPNVFFGNTTQILYYMSISTNRNTPPIYSTMDSSKIFGITTSNSFIYWTGYNDRNSTASGWASSRWATLGWSNPATSYSTWLNEITSKFNTIKAGTENSYGNNWNVYVMKYQFLDSPFNGTLEYAYFPIFCMGNEPNRDSLITI